MNERTYVCMYMYIQGLFTFEIIGVGIFTLSPYEIYCIMEKNINVYSLLKNFKNYVNKLIFRPNRLVC